MARVPLTAAKRQSTAPRSRGEHNDEGESIVFITE
jgi:hypothetical protein